MCNIPDEILSVLQKDIAEIKVALLGNEYNPSGGLLYRTALIEKELRSLEDKHNSEFEALKDKYNKIIWTVGTAAAIVSALISFISQFWGKISLIAT